MVSAVHPPVVTAMFPSGAMAMSLPGRIAFIVKNVSCREALPKAAGAKLKDNMERRGD